MMRSLYSGVSGLRNHQTRMDVIGNNIANVNTVAFKAGRTIFQDMYSQNMKAASAPGDTTGGTNPQQIGLGVTLATIDTLFTRSAAQVTGNTYDLMIENDGFFVVRNGTEEYYTRAGNFYFDNANYLVTQAGLYLMGYQAQISPGSEPIAEIESTLLLPDPFEDSNYIYRGTLDGEVTLANTNPAAPLNATLIFRMGDPAGPNNGQVIVFDGTDEYVINPTPTAGDTVTITLATGEDVNFTISNDVAGFNMEDLLSKKITINTGTVLEGSTIYTAKSSTNDPVIVGNPSIVSPGAKADVRYEIIDDVNSNTIRVVQIDRNGQSNYIDVVRPQKGGLVEVKAFGMEFFVSADYEKGDLNGVSIQMTGGADAITRGDPISTFSNSEDNLNMIYVDPILYNVTIDRNGTVYGIVRRDGFINCPTTGAQIEVFADQRIEIGQVCVAVFDNQQALEKVGDNLYRETANTGKAAYNKAGENGSGLIKPGALEMSNVDLAQEFTDMIVTQRGFQANSRIITVSDTLLEELINLKR